MFSLGKSNTIIILQIPAGFNRDIPYSQSENPPLRFVQKLFTIYSNCSQETVLTLPGIGVTLPLALEAKEC